MTAKRPDKRHEQETRRARVTAKMETRERMTPSERTADERAERARGAKVVLEAIARRGVYWPGDGL